MRSHSSSPPQGGFLRQPARRNGARFSAIERGQIAGACLDVVEPEPLPPSHPLWSFPNVLVTPHVAHPWEQHYEPYARRVAENVARFLNGAELLGVVDPERSY